MESIDEENNNPLVSVVVVTYNHEKYIAQCLESLIAQDANFSYEVIVGDDCSTDTTQTIISEYQKKYPDIIKPVFQERNTLLVDKKNFSDAISAASGKYIAFVDGDDYVFKNKLRIQVDFLEKNKDVGIAHHKMEVFVDDNRAVKKAHTEYLHDENIITVCQYSTKLNCIYHSSKMFRRDIIPDEGLCFDTDKSALDYVWIMQMLIKSKLKIGYIDCVLGVYRVGIGVTVSKSYAEKGKRGHLYAIELLERSGVCLQENINFLRSITLANFGILNLQLKNYVEFNQCFTEANKSYPLKNINRIFYIFRNYPTGIRLLYNMSKNLRKIVFDL